MSRRDFIRRNRETIDAVIRAYGIDGRINDAERENWVLNDEGLYQMARRSGVNV